MTPADPITSAPRPDIQAHLEAGPGAAVPL